MPHIHELYDFTASAFILHPTEPKICLHFHKVLKTWLQIGGHIELHEDPLQALHHEVKEEAGLNPDEYNIIEPVDQPQVRSVKKLPMPIFFMVHKFSDMNHHHIDMEYLLRSKTDRLTPGKDEAKEIGWFSLEEIKDLNKKGLLYDNTLDLCEWVLSHYGGKVI